MRPFSPLIGGHFHSFFCIGCPQDPCVCIIANSRVNSKVWLHLFEGKFEAFAFLNFVNWVFNPVLKHKNGVDLFEKDISESLQMIEWG